MLLRGLFRGLLRGLRSGLGVSFGPGSLVPVSVVTSSDTTNQDAYALGTVSLAANELGLLWIVQTATAADGVASFTGTFGGTWDLVGTFAVATLRISCYRGLSSSAQSGTLIANFAADDVTTGCLWSIHRVPGVDTSGSNGAGAIVQFIADNGSAGLGATVILDDPLSSSSNRMVYGITHAANEGAAPGSMFTELGDTSMATPGHGLMVAHGPNQSDAPTWSTSSVSRWVAVEVKHA